MSQTSSKTQNKQITVQSCNQPRSDYLLSLYKKGDFVDCFTAPSEVSPRSALQEVVEFPGWAKPLLIIRKLITAPFGLSQDGPESENKIGAFPVVSETNEEIIAGFNDKHLNFLVSVQTVEKTVSLTTWVRCHGLPGRLYLGLIMPFHILIARNAVSRVAHRFPA